MNNTQQHFGIIPACEYTLKSIKDFVGREGPGFSANLYHNNKKVATVLDDANGGPIRIYFIISDKEIREDVQKREAAFNSFVNSLPRSYFLFPDDFDPDLELDFDGEDFVSRLFITAMTIKELKKDMKRTPSRLLSELK